MSTRFVFVSHGFFFSRSNSFADASGAPRAGIYQRATSYAINFHRHDWQNAFIVFTGCHQRLPPAVSLVSITYRSMMTFTTVLIGSAAKTFSSLMIWCSAIETEPFPCEKLFTLV